MDPEEVIDLFDSCWFKLEILKNPSQISSFETNPELQSQENEAESVPVPVREPGTSRIPSMLLRTKSDQLSSMASFTSSDSSSPSSVLFAPRLETIVSGKETKEEEDPTELEPNLNQNRVNRSMRRRTQNGMTKSLSDLEFQELKGFMDLGFVFSEEDKNSRLVEIIPGLQRLGKKDNETAEISSSSDESSVSRPYLSEAWEVWEKRKRENPLMYWKVPALGNDIDIKDSLKWWAHTVASTVR
ncbi:hypothetical protein NMG60_11012874 [Bertholletia excelsa]